TKSFTATSIMQLVEQGLIELDAPVSRYLPYFKIKNEALTQQLTVRQVLSHTAGFPGDFWIASLQDRNLARLMQQAPEYHSILEQFPEDVLNTINNREDVSKYFSNAQLLYEPGQGWHYCTDAYVIAADILRSEERRVGKVWRSL